jgi:hypothetical protein
MFRRIWAIFREYLANYIFKLSLHLGQRSIK